MVDPATDQTRRMRTTLFMAAAILLIGIGYLAILPPFEGFDEPAHYSSVRQIADIGTLPLRGHSFIDQNVQDYEQNAPMPWATGNPPFYKTGSMTYPSFFASADAMAHYEVYRRLAADKLFAPGPHENWESQQPPLYYVLIAPLMKVTERFSLVTQIFILRLASYLLAFAGFMLGWRATWSHAGKTIPYGVATGFLLFPFVVPMFFVEFARIGNDSLCLFLLGLISSLSLRVQYGGERDLPRALALGVCFALGLLTKALFLPVLAGYALFMMLRTWRARHHSTLLRRRFMTLVLVVVPALLLGGGWYLYEFAAYGSPTGSGESILLAQQGGLFGNLSRSFSVYVFVRDIVVILVSWSWAGSWSLARVSPILHFPLLLLTGWIIVSYVWVARRRPCTDPVWLPVWLFAPFFAGLVYHILVVIALGISGTPGWYLNILAPFLATAMGYGIERISRNATERVVLGLSLIYAALFLLIVLWSQMALFAGCAIKNDHKYYQFTGQWFCLDRLGEVTTHLSVLGWPIPAFASLGVGFLCLAAGLVSFLQWQERFGQLSE